MKSSIFTIVNEVIKRSNCDGKSKYDEETRNMESMEVVYVRKLPIIICHTEVHDRGNIYDRLLGVPKNAGTLPYGFVDKGTKIFVYYKYPVKGIKTIVRAKGPPYEDSKKVPEWSDEWPREDYRHRIDTEPIARFEIPVLYQELVRMGIRRRDTGTLFCTAHLRGTVVPIREEDGAKIEAKLREKNRSFLSA